jgi:hypothetical protein
VDERQKVPLIQGLTSSPSLVKNRTLLAACLILTLVLAGWFLIPPPRPAAPNRTGTPAATLASAAAHRETPAKSASNKNPALAAAVHPTRTWARPVSLKKHVPAAADAPVPGAKSLPLSVDFLDRVVDADGHHAHFALPDGRTAAGTVELIRHDDLGVLLVQGRLTEPEQGMFFFQRQTVAGVAGALVGNVRFDEGKTAFRVDPTGPGGTPQLVPHFIEQVICANLRSPIPRACRRTIHKRRRRTIRLESRSPVTKMGLFRCKVCPARRR